MSRPSSAIASARSSLQSTARTAATVNSVQRLFRAAQYANSNGPSATASGWKNSHVSHWYVGFNKQRGAERDPGPLRLQQIAGEQEDRDRAARLRQDLHDEQEDRTRAEPIERHEQEQEDVRVVAEELEPADRDERVLGPREQPRALVVDAEVEAERPEAVVPQHRETDELVRPQPRGTGRGPPRASPTLRIDRRRGPQRSSRGAASGSGRRRLVDRGAGNGFVVLRPGLSPRTVRWLSRRRPPRSREDSRAIRRDGRSYRARTPQACCIFSSMSTPAGRSRRCSASTVLPVGSTMSMRRL